MLDVDLFLCFLCVALLVAEPPGGLSSAEALLAGASLREPSGAEADALLAAPPVREATDTEGEVPRAPAPLKGPMRALGEASPALLCGALLREAARPDDKTLMLGEEMLRHSLDGVCPPSPTAPPRCL